MSQITFALFFLVVLIGSSVGQDQSSDMATQFDEQMPPALDIGATLISEFLNTDLVQSKLRRVFDLIDLKIRLIRFIKSVLTRENFVLLHNFLDLVGRGANFVASFLPDASVEIVTTEPNNNPGGFLSGVVEALFPSVPVNQPENPVYESSSTTTAATESKSDNNGQFISRVNRNAQKDYYAVDEEQQQKELLEQHKDDVLQVARLIYNN